MDRKKAMTHKKGIFHRPDQAAIFIFVEPKMTKRPTMSKTRKWIQAILALVFLSFALLQLNDPDPLRWFLIYFLVAALCISTMFVQTDRRLLYFFLAVLLAYAAYHFPYFTAWMGTEPKSEIFGEMVYEKPYLEGSREFFGLLLAAGAISYLLFRNTSENKGK